MFEKDYRQMGNNERCDMIWLAQVNMRFFSCQHKGPHAPSLDDVSFDTSVLTDG